MVRWRESVANMAEAGVEEFVELGGKVLGPMVKRIVARREGHERRDDRGHRSAGEGDFNRHPCESGDPAASGRHDFSKEAEDSRFTSGETKECLTSQE